MLPIPPAATGPDAREILRVWTAAGAQHFSILPDAWRDPAAWGLLFVDLARHIAHNHSNPVAALARIKEGFDAEWQHPTDCVRP